MGSSYERVIPRDLFNEAKLLKCLGRLALLHLDGFLGDMQMVYTGGTRGFDVAQDPSSGDLWAKDVRLLTRDGWRVHLHTPYNDRSEYPLMFHHYPDEDHPVFDEEGQLTDEFREAWGVPDRRKE